MNVMTRKPIVYIDMDGTLVDFRSGLEKTPREVLEQYRGHEDDIPGIFGKMEPMPGAIEAVHRLNEIYDLRILSTAPWNNPSAWSDKIIWVQKYLDDIFHKKVILSHDKSILKGDILIDDRSAHGTSEFEGKWIHFGSSQYPDWKSVINTLMK